MSLKTSWVIDPIHSEVGFKIKHLMISYVKGSFAIFEANVVTTGDDFMSAEIDFSLDPSSISTGNTDRDAHLRGQDFFDVDQHPQITFKANTFETVDTDGSYELWGELTMKGISKKIKLNVEFGGVAKDAWGNEKAGFTINGNINRKDWGLVWNTIMETGGVVVSEELHINCEIQLLKANEEQSN